MDPSLSKGEIQLIRHLADEEPSRASELSAKTGLRRATVSRGLSALSRLGLIDSERQGKAKLVRLSDTKHAIHFRNLMVHGPDLRYDLLLAGRSLDVLAAIHLLRLSSIREIEEFSGASHVTVVKLLGRYRQRGAVRKREGTYRLGARYGMLGEFLREFRSYTNLRMLRGRALDAAVVWERDRDVLFRSSAVLERPFQPSAFSAFPRFGVDLFVADGHYYFSSPRATRIGLEQVVLHAMLAADTPRERLLILLLMLKADPDERRLSDLAKVYGTVDRVRGFLDYLRSRGRARPPGFPSWEELSRRRREYA